MNRVKYYVTRSVFSFVYAFITSLTAAAILCIEDLVWLKALLSALNLLLYIYIVGAIAFKDGEQALKVRNNNDFERQIMVKTGQDRPLKLTEEFKPWKGFVIGAIACIPVCVLMIIHAIATLINPANISVGAYTSFLYMFIFSFFRLNVVQSGGDTGIDQSVQANATVAPELFYLNLLVVPVLLLSIGVGYYLGGKKVERDYQKLKERQRIYSGDK